MKCKVEYRHPVTGNYYYFVDFREVDGSLKPVGCFRHPISYSRNATIFSTKQEAMKVVHFLRSLGYQACLG